MARIYVASSWKNTRQPHVVERLLNKGHSVYDFRNPHSVDAGFSWAELDPNYQKWSPAEYRKILLTHPRAAQGFMADFRAMQWADTGLLVMPCGRSAHLELGWMAGAGKSTFILLDEDGEPELMNLLADGMCCSLEEVIEVLTGF